MKKIKFRTITSSIKIDYASTEKEIIDQIKEIKEQVKKLKLNIKILRP